MFEFIGVYKVKSLIEKQYAKIVTEDNDIDQAQKKLEEYLDENGIKWFETEIAPLKTVIE